MHMQQSFRRGLGRGIGRTGLALVAVALVTACGPIVRSDYDSKTSLSNYKTFAWEFGEEKSKARSHAFYNPMNEKRLRNAVTEQLSRRGLQPAAEGAPADALVSVALGSRQAYERDSSPRWGFGWGWGWGRRGYSGFGMSSDTGYYYREGRISLDIFDAKSREPIWHADVDTDITTITGEDAEKRINSAVAAMFAKLPVKS